MTIVFPIGIFSEPTSGNLTEMSRSGILAQFSAESSFYVPIGNILMPRDFGDRAILTVQRLEIPKNKKTARRKAKPRNPGERTVRAAFQKKQFPGKKMKGQKNTGHFLPHHFFAHNPLVR